MSELEFPLAIDQPAIHDFRGKDFSVIVRNLKDFALASTTYLSFQPELFSKIILIMSDNSIHHFRDQEFLNKLNSNYYFRFYVPSLIL